MKRDARLAPLSRDHHRALILARDALAAAESGDKRRVRSLWQQVQRAYADDLAPHFALEEEVLLPAGRGAQWRALAEHLRLDHRHLRRVVHWGGARPQESLLEFGTLLRAHVQWEEQVFFETAQTQLSGAALQRVHSAHPEQAAPRGAGARG